jgi:hypothetical protein
LLQEKGWTVTCNNEDLSVVNYRPTQYDVTAATGYIPDASGWRTNINTNWAGLPVADATKIIGGVIISGSNAYGWIDTPNIVNGYALMAH